MKLVIDGGNTNQKKAIEEMLPWLVKKLMPRLIDTIEITVSIYNMLGEEGCWAGCEPDIEYLKNVRPRRFSVGIHNKLKMVDFRLGLCHELVHMMQHAKGRLYHYTNGDTRWKDKIYQDYDPDNDLVYWEVPWEEEARGKEHGLFQHWLAYKKGLHKKK